VAKDHFVGDEASSAAAALFVNAPLDAVVLVCLVIAADAIDHGAESG